MPLNTALVLWEIERIKMYNVNTDFSIKLFFTVQLGGIVQGFLHFWFVFITFQTYFALEEV